MRPFSLLLAVGLFLCGLSISCRAQSPASAAPSAPLFPFVLPWDDAGPGTVTDVSFLNAKPAGTNGKIVARDGHFVEGKTGKRVRFLGVNFAANAAFPEHGDAEKVAGRLAKMGVNIVRFHHMDNHWGNPRGTIWDDAFPDQQHISASQLDKLDYLIAQLKKQGIYSNLNLHVSREFSEADGFPASVKTLGYAKRVDNFDRRMILLQKNYARDLLAHVNPYTKLSLAADPCVAVVEINNENSLVGDPWATLGADLDNLPEPFRGELVGFWNGWLAKKYATDAKVKTAWLAGVTPPGPNLLTRRSQWTLEHQGTAQAASETSYSPDVIPGMKVASVPNVKVNVTHTDGTNWHVQAHQTGLDFKDGGTYTVSFRAKADKPRAMGINAGLDQADWHSVGLSVNTDLTTDWKTFRYSFAAHDTVPHHNRVAFQLGDSVGTVEIAGLKIAPGAAGAGLAAGQTLAKKNIGIPVSATKPQRADWLAFLADTERRYADEMRGYLKTTLKVQANVIDSQISWGGLTGLNREANMEFADNHAYWQHPNFPHKAWDAQDWTIGNTSMVSALANGGGTLRELAQNRVAGKPYSVSEYNHPAPSDFQAEMMPIFATFAAVQDWDMIYAFDYGDYGAGAANDKIQGYFGVGSNPAKMAFFPAAALIFRASEIPPAPLAVQPLLPAQLRGDEKAGGVWKKADIFKTRLALLTPARAFDIPLTSPAAALVASKTPSGAQYAAATPAAQSVVGFVGGQTIALGPATLTFPNFGNGFAAVTLTAMDEKPLASSQKMLLTLVGKVENNGMVWNKERTSVGDQWGTGPTMAEGIPATVTLTTDGPRKVYALDGTGKRATEVKTEYAGGKLTFTVGPQFKTVWYEVAK